MSILFENLYTPISELKIFRDRYTLQRIQKNCKYYNVIFNYCLFQNTMFLCAGIFINVAKDSGRKD